MSQRNLTTEEMAAALAQQGQPYQTSDGRWVIPMMRDDGMGGQNGSNFVNMGFGLYDPDRMAIGDSYATFDTQGNYKGDTEFAKESDGYDLLLLGALAAGGMHWLLPGAAGAGAAGAGVSGAAFGDAGLMYAGADGLAAGTLGGGASVGGGAALGAGAGGLGIGASEMVNGAFLGENMASGIPAWDAAATKAGLSLTYPAAALPSLPNLPNSPSPSAPSAPPTPSSTKLPPWVAPAAVLTSGLLGSQKPEGQEVNKRMDPRLDAYIYGEGGLLPRTQGLLNQQMPIAQQTGDQVRNIGMGLLNMPVAGNGFSYFYGQ